MKSNKIVATVLVIALAAACMLLLFACAKPAQKDSYTVTYNLNDGTGDKRALTVATGYAATDWQPVRAGFVLVNWCTDKNCATPYDFEQGVYADTELYANWMAQAEARTVAVDANYGGARHYRSVIVRDGEKLSEEQMPEINKFGMVLEGWYTDAACKNKYDFNSAVTKDMTLYANYSYNGKIARYSASEAAQIEGVKEGDIKFEDVELEIYCKKGGVYGLFKGVLTEMDNIIKEFNAEYGKTYTGDDGKEHYRIRVKAATDIKDNEQDYIWNATITDQSRFQLRVQQIPETNNNLKNYLNINDLLDLANADTSYYDRGDWYAINDSYVNGGLLSVPLGAKVPFIVYNKAQMDAVLGDGGKLPTKYSEFADVFTKAWAQFGSTAGYQTFIQNRAWPYRECVSAAAFIQNGIPYYRYDTQTNYYYTDWGTTEGYAKALTAATNMNNLLGSNGSCHGALVNHDDNKNDITYIVNPVASGKAFAGIVSWYDDVGGGTDVLSSVITNINNGKLGVLPLSGLYSDSEDEWSGKIPVNTVGIQVCTLNADKRSEEYFAACALLSDFVVRRADRFAKYGVVPLNKELANSSIFEVEPSAQSDVIKLLNAIVGDPNNLYTMDGYVLGKPLATEIAGTKPLLGYLDYILAATDPATIDKYVTITANKLTSTFVNGGF